LNNSIKEKQGTNSKAEQPRRIVATSAMASSLAKKIGSTSTADTNGTGSNGRSGKDKYSDDVL